MTVNSERLMTSADAKRVVARTLRSPSVFCS